MSEELSAATDRPTTAESRVREDDAMTNERPAAVTDYTVDPERIRATCRMLLNSGDITPIGVRMIEEALPDGDA